MNVKIKLLEGGKKPEFKRNGDACADCVANESVYIKPGERKLVSLGFCMELPDGYEAVIRPRSGMSKKAIDVAIGTIDSNYRGEVKANVINNSLADYEIMIGDRICQMAVRKTENVIFEEAEELSETVRGSDGFGSSGK